MVNRFKKARMRMQGIKKSAVQETQDDELRQVKRLISQHGGKENTMFSRLRRARGDPGAMQVDQAICDNGRKEKAINAQLTNSTEEGGSRTLSEFAREKGPIIGSARYHGLLT